MICLKYAFLFHPAVFASVWLRHDLEVFDKRLKALETRVAQDGIILTEAQVIALERKKQKREAFSEIETEHPGYLGSQNTYYGGNIKGVGRIYQQTFIDTYSRVAFAKLYESKPEHHEYELYLQIEGIEHSKPQMRHPQSNGICERLHRTIQEELYAVAFKKKLYNSLSDLQQDLDEWTKYYNLERTHSGRYCYGKTPMETF